MEDVDDPLSDEILGAYIDGELTPIERKLVERLLDENEEAQFRMTLLHIIHDLLRAGDKRCHTAH